MKRTFHTPVFPLAEFSASDGTPFLVVPTCIAQLHKWLLSSLFVVILAAPNFAMAQSGAAANIDQVRNGPASAPVSPAPWVNGNAGASNAHYLEGHSIPYRIVVTGLTPGIHTIVIEWDIRQGGKNALDFITQYQSLRPHAQFVGHLQPDGEVIDPLAGLGLISPSVAFKTIDAPAGIPADAGVASPTRFSYYALKDLGKEVMTMFNGTDITSMTYLTQGDRTAASSSTSLSIVFTTTKPTVVFAWGGHIASQKDWGPGTSAVNINGSPYHTRLISIDGSGGNQDRSLSAAAVIQPPTCAFTGGADASCSGSSLTFTGPANMDAYSWTVTPVTTGGATPTSGTNQSITVTATSSYTISLLTTKSGVMSDANCSKSVTINTPGDPTATGATRCGSGSVTLSSTLGANNGTGNHWYATSTSTTVLTTGLTYDTPSLSTNTTYYVASFNTTCEGARVPAVATINAIAPGEIAGSATGCSPFDPAA
ncbi:immunoglobulin domain-containing protein, partial [Hymenobacter frigidus]|uniref:immunoglobulin domain-containing protein n=1 Tax=Hymenobacter frigidus TaxID=1524095 RepID=UPI001665C5D1